MKDNHFIDESIKIVTAAAVTLAAGKVGGFTGEKLTDGSRYMYHHVQALYEHMQGHV